MKIRLIIKRTVYHPTDTTVSVEFRTIDVDFDKTTERFMRGTDIRGCEIIENVIGYEILDGKET